VHVFELTWPGGFLQGLPDDEVMAVEALLRKLEGALAGAAVGLCLFEEQMVTFRDRMREEFAEHLEYMDAVSELAARYRREPSPNRSIDKYGRVLDDSHDRASRDLARARWEAGNWPKAYIWRLPEIHARTVIYSLDEIGKTIAALAAMPNMPEGVTEARLPSKGSSPPSLPYGIQLTTRKTESAVWPARLAARNAPSFPSRSPAPPSRRPVEDYWCLGTLQTINMARRLPTAHSRSWGLIEPPSKPLSRSFRKC
jgi:hypothetical protein